MDKNTITGIVLIFLIFLGFSVYNNQRTGKVFEAETEYADSLYAAGNYDDAREAYIRALGYRPKDQTTMDRVIELNNKLGLGTAGAAESIQAAGDSDCCTAVTAAGNCRTCSSALGVFSASATGDNEFLHH